MASSSQTIHSIDSHCDTIQPFIRVRLTSIDHVLTPVKDLPQETAADRRRASEDARHGHIPYVFRSSPIFGRETPVTKVPVIRIFGATELGQRCCVHVHGAVPYVYVEYKGDMDPDIVHDYILRFGRALNQAIGSSLQGQRKVHGQKAQQFVGFVALVKGIPFYGFHVGYRFFLKILLLQPQMKTRMCIALKSGAIMKTVFETFEAHINFEQQFMTDYNLYGCGYVDFERVKFRDELPSAEAIDILPPSSDSSDATPSRVLFSEGSIPLSMRFPPGRSPARISPHSSLELDVHVSAILNRHRVKPRLLHHDFTELLHHPIPDETRLVSSVRELWDEEAKRAKEDGRPPPVVPKEPQGDRRCDAKRGESPVWANSALHQKLFNDLVELDTHRHRQKNAGRDPKVEAFARQHPAEVWIKTAFESTVSLYPATWEDDERTANQYGVWAVRGIGVAAARASVPPSETNLDLDETRLGTEETMAHSAAGISEAEDFVIDLPSDDEAEQRARDRRAGVHSSEEDDETDTADDNVSKTPAPAPAPPQDKTPSGESRRLQVNSSFSSASSDDRIPNDIEKLNTLPNHSLSRVELRNSRNAIADLGDLADVSFSTFRPSSPAKPSDDAAPILFEADKSVIRVTPGKGSFGRHAQRALRTPAGHVNGDGYGGQAKRSRDQQIAGWYRRGETTLEKMLKRGQTHAEADGIAKQWDPESMAIDGDDEADPRRLQSHQDDQHSDQDGSDQSEYKMPPLYQERSVPDLGDDEYSDHPLSPTQITGQFDLDLDTPGDISNEDSRPTKIRRLESAATADGILPTTAMSSIESATSVSGGATSSTVTPDVPSAARLGRILEKATVKQSSSSATLSDSATASHGSLSSAPSYRGTRFRFAKSAPTCQDITTTVERLTGRQRVWQIPYFSRASDVPDRTWEYASRSYRLLGSSVRWLDQFQPAPGGNSAYRRQLMPMSFNGCVQIAFLRNTASGRIPDVNKSSSMRSGLSAPNSPFTPRQVISDLRILSLPYTEQMEALEQPNQFKFTQMKQQYDGAVREPQHMAILAMELQARSRTSKSNGVDLRPDPAQDPIDAIFYCVLRESDGPLETGYIAVRDVAMPDLVSAGKKRKPPKLGLHVDNVYFADSELDLINEFCDRFHEWDAEVLCGFEVQYSSWGYLLERAQTYDMELIRDLGRTSLQSTGKHKGKEDRWGYTTTSSIKFTGRHTLPIWRVLKADVNLNSYTFENVAFHVLRERVPAYTPKTLTVWMASREPTLIARTFEYWLRRAIMDVRMLDSAEIVTRNAEFARIYGVDFASVLQRGSQYKVESFMFRIAKPESFVLLSPNRVEVGKQNAAECVPLIMEPRSAFYHSPVIVLDFQSLYPSCMIAYNMCYSTCLGRLQQFKGTWKLGTTRLRHDDGTLALLQDYVNITPNGIMFLKPFVRRSLLAKMLTEILDTRVMIKSSMKRYNDKALLKMLNARQLGLKFIANVTYGYTSATFSGRMPCVEIADAIVQTGRETLERAKDLIEEKKDWGAKVVYGDTDSLFVELKGKTRDEAFRIGRDIADWVTRVNPVPVKLKFEKVYLGSFLLAKKRYVGAKFENEDDAHWTFDAKGIETVRRDGFPAMQKMVEEAIRIMFRSQDVSEVKAYVTRQWQKLQLGMISPQDYVFAKEVKLGTYSENGQPPPGALLAGIRTALDHRAEPNYGERVPYVLTDNGKRTQNERALTIEEFMKDSNNRLWVEHYIKMMTRALGRLFNVAGVNVETWQHEMKSVRMVGRRLLQPDSSQAIVKLAKHPKLISHHYASTRCLACRRETRNTDPRICDPCAATPAETLFGLVEESRSAQQRVLNIHRICTSCSSSTALRPHEKIACESIDCPIFYTRKRAQWDAKALSNSDHDAALHQIGKIRDVV